MKRENRAPFASTNERTLSGVLRGFFPDPFGLTSAADNFGISSAPDFLPLRTDRRMSSASSQPVPKIGQSIRGFIMGVTDVCIFGEPEAFGFAFCKYLIIKDRAFRASLPKPFCTGPTVA